MGFRFRKSVKIAPGVRVNIGKKSASVSVGPKGMKQTFSTTGRKTTTVGIPGSGLSYSSSSKMGGGSRSGNTGSGVLTPASERPTSPKSKAVALILCIFLGVVGAHRYYVGKIGTGVLWTFTAGCFGIGWIVDIFTILAGGFYDSNGYVLRGKLTETDVAAAEYIDADPAELWAQWSDKHASHPQRERMKRASDGELTPDVFSEQTKCATFIGGSGSKYTTTLFGCSCPDFQERGLPCKHMYWIAQKLELDGSECPDAAGGDLK